MSYIFFPDRGETPQAIARKREIADRIMYGRRRSPQNIGEGIAALGDGIVAGVLNRRANKAEEAGFARQGELRDQIIRMMTGGQDLPFPPAPGGESPSGGSNAASAGGALPSSFLSAVDRYEGAGGYDTLFGHAQRGPFSGTDVSQMSVGEAMAFANPRGAYGQHVKGQIGRVATPMGRHQIVGTTLRNASREMGLDPSTPFNAGTQDAIAAHLARRRIAGASTMDGKIAGLRAEWEGFKHVPRAQMEQIVRDLEASPSGAVAATQAMATGQPMPASIHPFAAGVEPGVGVAETEADILAQEAAMAQQDPQAFQQPGLAPSPFVPQQPSPGFPAPQSVQGRPGAPMQQPRLEMSGLVDIPQNTGRPDLAQLVQWASDPWLPENMKSVVSSMLQQEMANRDPMRQLQMQALQQQINQGQSLINAGGGRLYDPNSGQWISAPGAGQPDIPDAFQALQLRAQAAGLQPGTPEYQQFMADGGRSTNDSAAVQRIDRMAENLMATGDFIDPQEARNIAVGIVDGRLKADRHPITGELQVVDMATGQPVYGRGAQGQTGMSPMLPAPETPMTGADQFGRQFPASNEAFGVPGALAGGINRVTDAIGVGPVYPEVQQTQADFGVLRESLLNDMSSAYGRQPPSWLLKEIRDLTPAAGSPFEGASGAQSKLNAIGRHLTSELAATDQALQRELSPQNRQELESRRAGLQMGIDRVTGALQSFGEQEASPAGSQIMDGQTATNPQTGQRIIYRGGRWEPMQ